jgi:type IV pilus assembly protein PilX
MENRVILQQVPYPTFSRTHKTSFTFTSNPRSQRGVVLIVTLVMLLLMSIASASAIRSATSSESVANNERTQSLAFHAAETALRYCESRALAHMNNVLNWKASGSTGVTPTSNITFVAGPDYSLPTVPLHQWKSLAIWDATTTSANITVVPLNVINASTTNIFTAYQREPECMVEYASANTDKSAIITARGFGPEVVDGTGKPVGSEVWLQSTLQADTRTSIVSPGS